MSSITVVIESDTASPMLNSILQSLGIAKAARLTLGATAPYAGYVEFGTRRMAAEPYIRPSVDAYTQQVVEAFANGLMTGEILQNLEMVGAEMEAMARSIVPVDTGFLRSTIYHLVT